MRQIRIAVHAVLSVRLKRVPGMTGLNRSKKRQRSETI